MSHVFHRHLTAALPKAVRGEGPYLIDAEGKRYLDASGGAAVSCLGHSHPRVIAAIKEQLEALPFAHTAFFTNDPMEKLATRLVESVPPTTLPLGTRRLDKVYFVSGGSEAVEAALKLGRQYFLERGEPKRRHVIARRQSYHGNTLGALSIGGNQWRRAPFEPLLLPTTHVSPCYPYRDQAPGESDAAYGERLADELEQTIQRLGPDSVIAFIAEPVVGATAGALVPVPGYFARMREICDRYGVLLILDEVMCGMGRTGTLFAFEQEPGLVPDMVAIAKGLGAGYQPIGALMVARHIHEALREGSGFFQHGHTYMGHATACAAALAVQETLEAEGLLARARESLAPTLWAALQTRFGDHPHVGDIRGRGLFLGLELVEDRDSKRPFSPQARLNARVKQAALQEGLICYPMGGTIDGQQGDHILLAPPFILEAAEVELLVERLAGALEAALAGL